MNQVFLYGNQIGTSGSYGTYVQPVGTAGGSGGYGYVVNGIGLHNYAHIGGGNGGNGGDSAVGGTGGAGVDVLSGTLTNSIRGFISGGNGGNGGRAIYHGTAIYGGYGGNGGAGVDLSSGTGAINDRIVAGGTGGAGGYGTGFGGRAGAGGAGFDVNGATLTNTGSVTGGYGGYGGRAESEAGAGGAGGVGVYLSSGSVTNRGSITGGAGGHGGLSYTGYGGGNAGAGGVGVNVSAGTLTNTGTITGGAGGFRGIGGVGSGAAGVNLSSSGSATNDGTVTGGAGASGEFLGSTIGDYGGGGGAGFEIAGGTLTNNASITGGAGGAGAVGAYKGIYGTGGGGGDGGTGVVLDGGTLINAGNITGGAGGAGGVGGAGYKGGYGGTGGVGVFLNGSTLTTSGTISGGAGGSAGVGPRGHGPAGAAGNAVQFGGVASTLVVEPGAVFNGQVAAYAYAPVDDTLKLSGIQAGGTPITLGTQFTNFSTLAFGSGAAWTVDVSTVPVGSPELTINAFRASDTIDITNLTPTQVAADFNSTTHVLTTPGDGTLDFSGAFSSNYFIFTSDAAGKGTDITLAPGSIISTTVTSTVTVGSAAHASPLTITSSGKVAPGANGATAVVSSISNNSVANEGTIQGGAGALNSSGVGGMGGMGVNLKAGTLTNTGSISGGAGGNGAKGGHGGAGVELNGGTLITSGTIFGGVGGAGSPVGAAGDAVQFGTAASTLIVDPGAVFNGQVVGNASVHDVLELSGTQAGGTAITLGTQFTNFSALAFAPGATGTVDATIGDLTSHPLNVQGSIAGFGLGDTLDITKLVHAGTSYNFDASTEILSITKGATTIQLGFDSAFTGEHFVLASDGHGGTDVTLQTGAASEPMALHGFSSHAFIDHGLAHDASVMMS
jgi:fibronectin-binding autotransporter adhesin